jgi:hypothetical protein
MPQLNHSTKLGAFPAAVVVYVLALGIEFFIASGSAKAFLMMPIVLPLADIIGVTRQTAVLAYIFGDGFSNLAYPTNPVLLISLGLTVVSYPKWLRWTAKLWLWVILATVAFLGSPWRSTWTVLMDSLFPESYISFPSSSRARFLRDVELLRAKWASSRLETHPLKNFPDLSIDWLWAEPRKKENLVIITTAEHGIEGYVGSAMLKIFMDEFAAQLNPESTGMLSRPCNQSVGYEERPQSQRKQRGLESQFRLQRF